MNEKSGRNFLQAEKLLHEFLLVKPLSLRGHLELAYLYQDDLDNPLKAAYHYRRYLEIAPDATDAEEVKALLDASERRLLERLAAQHGKTTYDRSGKIEAERKALLLQNQALREENERLKKTSSPQISLQTREDTRPQTQAHPEQPRQDKEQNQETQKRKHPEFYLVEPGDSLSKISRKIYGNTKYYRMIYQANKDIIPSEDSPLMIGQKLAIPEIE